MSLGNTAYLNLLDIHFNESIVEIRHKIYQPRAVTGHIAVHSVLTYTAALMHAVSRPF
jgi:hypothetical protein